MRQHQFGMRRFAVALILVIYSLAFAQQPNPAPVQTEQRLALVIGNSNYKESPLRNPGNDATDMAATLRELGFRVTLLTNANNKQMVTALIIDSRPAP